MDEIDPTIDSKESPSTKNHAGSHGESSTLLEKEEFSWNPWKVDGADARRFFEFRKIAEKFSPCRRPVRVAPAYGTNFHQRKFSRSENFETLTKMAKFFTMKVKNFAKFRPETARISKRKFLKIFKNSLLGPTKTNCGKSVIFHNRGEVYETIHFSPLFAAKNDCKFSKWKITCTWTHKGFLRCTSRGIKPPNRYPCLGTLATSADARRFFWRF